MLRKIAEILVVEDNPADASMLREALRQSPIPYRLRVVQDGAAALDLLSSCESGTCPDLVILDLNLPRRNGFEVLQAIRQNEVTASIPVIVMSSSLDHRDVERAYDSHANCFIVKPAELEELLGVVLAIENFWLSVAELPTH